MPGKYLACCFMGLSALGHPVLFAGRDALLGASQTDHRNEPRTKTGSNLRWTLYGQGYFSRRHGMFFLENDHLHVYGEVTAVADTTGKVELQGQRWPYSHEIYDLINGKWEKKLEELSQRPVHYLDFGPCDARDEIDLKRPDIAQAFRPWPGTTMKIKNVTEFPGGYAAVVYSEIPRAEGVSYGPEGRTMQVTLLALKEPGARLVT